MAAAAKLLLLTALLAALAASTSASLLKYICPKIISEFYEQQPTKQVYRFTSNEPNGSKREEIGVIMSPGIKKEQLVVMGSYSFYDEKTDTDTVTMYTADKHGYKARYQIKKRKLSPGALKSVAG